MKTTIIIIVIKCSSLENGFCTTNNEKNGEGELYYYSTKIIICF